MPVRIQSCKNDVTAKSVGRLYVRDVHGVRGIQETR
jgi:hypothetical protein